MEAPPVYMEQPKTPLQNVQRILTSFNIRALKEPRGFMKVLEFVFSICAFATTCDYSSSFSFIIKCTNGTGTDVTVSEEVTYPFNVDSIDTRYEYCNNNGNLHIMGNFSSDAQFFVAIGVLAFLYSIAAIILYCFLSQLYENNDNVPIGDFAINALLAFLWLAASSAWASSLTNMKSAMSVQTIMEQNPDMCLPNKCVVGKELAYSKLVISIIFGFLNMFLWASNLWFLYKETRYFKDKMSAEAGNSSTNQPMGAE